MVKVREAHPRFEDGTINVQQWLQGITADYSEIEGHLLQTAVELALQFDIKTQNHISCLEWGMMIADILHDLQLDNQSIVAGLLYTIYQNNPKAQTTIQESCSDQVVTLIQGLVRIDLVKGSKNWYSQTLNDVENLTNLRKMMLTVVQDIRVVLIKLAHHVCEMRLSVKQQEAVKKQLAKEALEVYAPLANRLAIGQIKWELEDLALRFQEPDTYKQIAKLLDERREDRQKYIEAVVLTLKQALTEQKIDAEITGRAKHIYSIWCKMHRKMVPYSEIYDVRAIRIIVPTIAACYSALGVVHTLWQHVPKEFDDYIANPKSNGYQSLHTALVGPSGKIIELQIRTTAMHKASELGVAAHWRYKEGISQEPDFENKLVGLRQLLNWQDQLVIENEPPESLRAEFFEDRVYVFSPKGDVIDLPKGATPLDFAYQIHTELGHRCRGAKIDGHMVPLTYHLNSGERVEVLTIKNATPSRDWLNPHLNYLKTSKAKARVHQWFKRQDREQNIQDGREIINREFKRLSLTAVPLADLVEPITNCESEEDLLAGVGNGDIRIAQVLGALQKMHHIIQPKVENEVIRKKKALPAKVAEVSIDGIGNLMCHMAKCCKPVPGDEIIGYITVGEGVSIHRQDCNQILQLQEQQRSNRLIEASWGSEINNLYQVDVLIHAYQRRELLRDITSVLAMEHADISNFKTLQSQESHLADIKLTLAVAGVEMLDKVLSRLQQIPNVIDVYRLSK